MDMDTSTAVADVTNVGATSIGRTTAVTNRFFRPEVPSVLLDHDANGDQDDLRDELEMRQDQYDTLKISKSEALQRLRRSEKDYKDFKLLSDRYMEADNVRQPDAGQTAIIHDLQTTVSSIVLTGDALLGNAREQTRNRMVKRLAELKEKKDADRKKWDHDCHEFETVSAALKSVKNRSGGQSRPIVDGKLMFCPFRGGAMIRSSTDIIIEIWSMINGPQMLELRFDRLFNAVRDLRKSLKAETLSNKPGE